MKTERDVLAALTRRLERSWAAAAAGEPVDWAPRIPLGQPAGVELAAGFAAWAATARDWTTWVDRHRLELETRARRVHGTAQILPVAILVPDVDAAARVLGDPWPGRLTRGRGVAARLTAQFPALDADVRVRVVRETADWSDLDVDLLCRAGAWFAANDATGLTPRQVPIAGMHAKWLNTSQHLVAALAGRDTLGLVTTHPARVHVTYLDPGYLAAGGRMHDCFTAGDRAAPPYPVRAVVICENKDTALAFPALAGGVVVEGAGRAVNATADLAWVRAAELVAYWGDMDADGLEILSGLRETGLPVVSLLMDVAAYQAWSTFGTYHDPRGARLTGRPPRKVAGLTGGELELYTWLCDPAFEGPRRVEQERIPLEVAVAALTAAAEAAGDGDGALPGAAAALPVTSR